jgi:hypothetical protein
MTIFTSAIYSYDASDGANLRMNRITNKAIRNIKIIIKRKIMVFIIIYEILAHGPE